MSADSPAAPQNRPDPAVLRGVIPYLSLDGRAAEAADFYARAFAARALARHPDAQNPDRLMHLHVEINGGSLMMSDGRAPWETEAPRPQGFTLHLVVGDGDSWWSRAVDAGCTVVVPFERQFWGDCWGMLRDPFGFQWAINEPAA